MARSFFALLRRVFPAATLVDRLLGHLHSKLLQPFESLLYINWRLLGCLIVPFVAPVVVTLLLARVVHQVADDRAAPAVLPVPRKRETKQKEKRGEKMML